ncbi:MAG: gamma-glutamylcyclotransferase family protein [Candidatus Xenobiia bacterium LiM19]
MPEKDVRKEKVFVYGTLMQGFRNYSAFLEGKASFCGRGSLKGTLYHLPQGYPGLIEGGGTVHGEVYELSGTEARGELDWLEGYNRDGDDNLYDRKRQTVIMEDGNQMECWIYVYCDKDYATSKGILITDGDWRAFRKER